MAYLVRLTDTKGGVHYAVNPFTHHALFGTREQAEEFLTEGHGYRWINSSLYCVHAFWESERAHARRIAEEIRGWKIEVISI